MRQPTRGGALSGSYAGAAADLALGVGGGGKVRIGGSVNSIVLQPLSVQGQTGLNFAFEVEFDAAQDLKLTGSSSGEPPAWPRSALACDCARSIGLHRLSQSAS